MLSFEVLVLWLKADGEMLVGTGHVGEPCDSCLRNECDVSWLRKEEGSLVIRMRAYMGCVMVLAEDAMWVRSLL